VQTQLTGEISELDRIQAMTPEEREIERDRAEDGSRSRDPRVRELGRATVTETATRRRPVRWRAPRLSDADRALLRPRLAGTPGQKGRPGRGGWYPPDPASARGTPPRRDRDGLSVPHACRVLAGGMSAKHLPCKSELARCSQFCAASSPLSRRSLAHPPLGQRLRGTP
jgi:hypothetical protein